MQGPASNFPAIEKKHGCPMAEWQDLVRARRTEEPGAEHTELVSWLKAERGTGHGHVNALVGHTLAQDAG